MVIKYYQNNPLFLQIEDYNLNYLENNIMFDCKHTFSEVDFMKFTESMLSGYPQPLSSTEDQQCKNAIVMTLKFIL